MPNPLYFDPDPSIEDSDLLGYGDLVFDDGTRRFLNGEPDIAASLDRMPAGPPEMGQPVPQGRATPDGIQVDMMGNITMPGQMGVSAVGQNAPVGERGGMPSQQSGMPDLSPQATQEPALDDAIEQQAPDLLAPAIGGGAEPQPIQGADGRQYEVSMTGDIVPAGQGGAPSSGLGSGGMVPYEREGALPQEMAQRQQGEMAQQNDLTLQAEQQARADAARIYNEANLKAMAENDAQRQAQQEELEMQRAKQERWQSEATDLGNMEIGTSLVDARGPVGAALGVIGAALLGAVGSDAGLRMIDKAITDHVNAQVNQRNTRLGILADKLGSTEQAIRMAKAELYKSAADRAELLAQKTKNDAYEAQTPAIIQGLRQKQTEEMQKAEQLSLGKTTERVPAPPKPPSQESLLKYGQLRRDRDGASGIASRAEQELGLMWTPGKNGQPGYYANKDEILKRGIQGVGALEQWVPDFVYSTMGGSTKEGYQVRGAAEAMAYAQIRQMQPTGPISNADIQSAVKAGALDTEDGFIRGLERIRQGNEQAEKHDEAEFGPDLVAQYNRQYKASGGQTMTATPAASRPATPEDLRRHQESATPAGTGNSAEDALRSQGKISQAPTKISGPERMAMVSEDIQSLAGDQLPPEGIAILRAQAAHETGDGEHAPQNNMFGHKATARRPGKTLMTVEGEGTNARRVPQAFAAFNSTTESVADHLSLLRRKYPRAWEALQVGDPSAYVAALKDGGYFTGNESIYLNRILQRL
jgi:flagellum-specific peptidoglycan hydrolase FlgJ